jgi:hypothetical protein
MHTKPFSPFCAAGQCSRRVEQIPYRSDRTQSAGTTTGTRAAVRRGLPGLSAAGRSASAVGGPGGPASAVARAHHAGPDSDPRHHRFSAGGGGGGGAAVNTLNVDIPAAFRGGVMLIAAQIVAKVL